MKTRILTRADIETLLTMDLAVPAVEQAFAAHGRGEALMPAKVYLDLPQYEGDFRAMPSYLAGSAGVKWVNSHRRNPEKHGLPTVLGMYILSDPDNAYPLAVMDATYLTAVRTGAAGGVAAKYLARPDAKTAGFIGCGVQARTLLAALRTALGRDLQWHMADANADAARQFADEAGGTTASIEQAAGCDIVCTATPVRAPIVERGWVADGALIDAMGADGPGKQELDPRILTDAKIVIDDEHQATESGEINVPLREGTLGRGDIYGTLGEIVAGKRPGRETDEIIVFDSTGLAIQDVALARAVYDAAVERGAGAEVDFVGA